MQEISWDIGGTARKGDYSFFYRRGNDNYQLGTGSFVQHRIISAVKRVEFLSGSVIYRRNEPDFGRVFLMLKYTDITQNTYVQS